MPVQPRRPASLRRRIFRGSAVLAAGTLSEKELRGPAWRRLFRDVYACAELPVTHSLRVVAAALLVPDGVVSGRSAAVLWGLAEAERDDDVELTVAPGSTVCRVSGIRVRRRLLSPAQITTRRGLRSTTAEETAIDLARTGSLESAVVLIDRFVAEGVTDLAMVRSAAQTVTGKGCDQVRRAVVLADGLAGSPQETRLRLLFQRSALPMPVAQFVVRDDAGFVARVDFAWPEAKIAVEYEGAWHGDAPQQVAADRRRLNRLTAAGWTVIFVTALDLQRPGQLVLRLAAALPR